MTTKMFTRVKKANTQLFTHAQTLKCEYIGRTIEIMIGNAQ